MKRKLETVIILLFGGISFLTAQDNELEFLHLIHAYELLEANYPTLKNTEIESKIYEREIQSLDIDNRPSIYLKADGRLQTESTRLDLPEGTMLPFQIDLPLYSAKTYAELQYQLIDGGMTEVQKNLKLLDKELSIQDVEIDRYHLKERINAIFLNISFLDEQSKIFTIGLVDLENKKEAISAMVEEGIALDYQAQNIEVRILELEAKLAQNTGLKDALIATLSSLTGQSYTKQLRLEYPSLKEKLIPDIKRPELKYLTLQQNKILAQGEMIDARRKPKLISFAQAGIGLPNPVNFFEEDLNAYALAGLQFQWNLSQRKNDQISKQLLQLKAEQLENKKESLLFDIESMDGKYLEDLNRIEDQIAFDSQILELQTKILNTFSEQLEEGVITSFAYVEQFNNELLSRQRLNLHQIEKLKVQIEFWNRRGSL